jgi:hypothetical protein
MDLVELRRRPPSRATRRPRAGTIADELTSEDGIVVEREDLRFVAAVPDRVNLKISPRSRTRAASSGSS